MASGNGGFGLLRRGGSRGSRPYRKHRPLPALALVTTLCVIAAVVWVNVAIDKSSVNDEIRCAPQAAPPVGVTFTPLPHGALRGIAPRPPAEVSVQVLNASSKLGQAGRTTGTLRELGFTQLGKPANDQAYATQEADCHGQIRFGPNGKAAARTISLLEPCLELIKTNRKDAGVDLVIGSDFRDIEPGGKARKVLHKLKSWAAQHDPSAGGEQAAAPQGPQLDPKTLRAIRDAQC